MERFRTPSYGAVALVAAMWGLALASCTYDFDRFVSQSGSAGGEAAGGTGNLSDSSDNSSGGRDRTGH
jgi:hypothetical protein